MRQRRQHSCTCACVCPHPLLGVAVVFGRSGSVWGLGALRQVFFQGGLLVQGGVAHVFIDGVYGHLSDVLRCLTKEKFAVNMTGFITVWMIIFPGFLSLDSCNNISLRVLPVLAWVYSGCSGFLPHSKNKQVRWIVDSKLPVGVNVSVNGCLSLCVSPAIVWRPVQGVPPPPWIG